MTASPHSPRHHQLCPWTREARAGPRGAPGCQALSVPMLLPRQGARGPRPDRLAPTVWPWPQSPHFAVARSPRLRDRAKAGGEVTPGARGASRTGGRGRHQRPPTPSADSRPSPRPCRLFSWWQRPHSAGTRKGTPVPHACAARGRRSGGFPGLLGEGPRARVCGQKLSKGKRGHSSATGSARNRAARRVATGSGTPRPDGRAQRCVRRELTVPCPSGSYLSHPA